MKRPDNKHLSLFLCGVMLLSLLLGLPVSAADFETDLSAGQKVMDDGNYREAVVAFERAEECITRLHRGRRTTNKGHEQTGRRPFGRLSERPCRVAGPAWAGTRRETLREEIGP